MASPSWRVIFLTFVCVLGLEEEEIRPYPENSWGSRHRQYRPLSNEPAYEVADVAKKDEGWPEVDGERIQGSSNEEYNRMTIKGNIGEYRKNGIGYLVKDPYETLSVLPPKEGCGNGGFTPKETSAGRCLVATNAGYFNTKTSQCHGTVVSDGKDVYQSDESNVSFGITKLGKIVVGYLSEKEKVQMGFKQLVNGVIWLVRNGTNYIDKSIKQESLDTQESGCKGPYDCAFRTMQAARLSIGHDSEGRVIVLAMDGWGMYNTHTYHPHKGQSLDEMADMMISLGAVNAINLDGGGSVGVYERGVQVNSPTDVCSKENGGYNITTILPQACVRRVSTILCIHKREYKEFGTCSQSNVGVYLLTILCVVGVINIGVFVMRCKVYSGRGQPTSPLANTGAKLPTYKRSPLAVKKLRKKRGAKQHQGVVDLELTSLPATGYDNDSEAEPSIAVQHHVDGEDSADHSPSRTLAASPNLLI